MQCARRICTAAQEIAKRQRESRPGLAVAMPGEPWRSQGEEAIFPEIRVVELIRERRAKAYYWCDALRHAGEIVSSFGQ
jgi:hypothetical protein